MVKSNTSKVTNSNDTNRSYATGRRKTSIARVFFNFNGSGTIKVNNKNMVDYFKRESYKLRILEPIKLASLVGQVDIHATVKGGGVTGQADAIRHAISLILRERDNTLTSVLRKAGMITRDSRKVERKKVGLRKARRATQFSKR